MGELIVLGSAASVPDAEHDSVYLALTGAAGALLIDCGGSPLHKLARLGVDHHDLQGVVLTHRHVDHLYGLPILLQGLWLSGRQATLPVYGPQEALQVAQAVLQALGWQNWRGMFPVGWRPVPLDEGHPLLTLGRVAVTSSPACHGEVECLALRLENSATGRVVVYSSDTAPCPAVVRLAQAAHLLVHEATGDHAAHSSPEGAAQVARQAGVAGLALIHYPLPHALKGDAWLRRAATAFPGPVRLAQDWEHYPV